MRLIDADALMEYCSNQKTKTISNNDIARFPTAQANRPHGEWIDDDGNNVPLDKDGYPLGSCYCNQCHEWLVGSDEYYTKGNYCPNCGAKMKKQRRITKEEAIEQIKWYFEEDDGIGAEDITKEAVYMAIEALSAEAAQGKWGQKNSHTFICNQCGFEQAIYGTPQGEGYFFCPHCGARMIPYKGGE